MKKEIKMSFGDFVFPTNPSKLEITLQQDINISSVYGGKSVTQSVCTKPTVIKGGGVFFGDDAQKNCAYLAHILKLNRCETLHCPGAYPMKAYLTSFSYELSAESDGIDFSFEFTERCSGKSETVTLDYTFALDGENAFDIAARADTSVDDIMKYNDFKTPFDIEEGERVNLNGNNADNG